MKPTATTLGQLKTSGWKSRSVKEEIRENSVARIRAGEPLSESILGYDDTVMPQLHNALLAGHDIVFLGERGQGKTRIIRSLTGLLDEWMPIVAGSEINDDPYHPVSRHARDAVAHHGDDTPITWSIAMIVTGRSSPPPIRRLRISSVKSTPSRLRKVDT